MERVGLGWWTGCEHCGSKAFAAYTLRGVLVWTCIACLAQWPVRALPGSLGARLRFATRTWAPTPGGRPSNWSVVEQGPAAP